MSQRRQSGRDGAVMGSHTAQSATAMRDPVFPCHAASRTDEGPWALGVEDADQLSCRPGPRTGPHQTDSHRQQPGREALKTVQPKAAWVLYADCHVPVMEATSVRVEGFRAW